MVIDIDNVLGFLPEDVAMKVDELLHPKWDHTGQLRGRIVFDEIINAYRLLGVDGFSSFEWCEEADVMQLYANNQIYVSRG